MSRESNREVLVDQMNRALRTEDAFIHEKMSRFIRTILSWGGAALSQNFEIPAAFTRIQFPKSSSLFSFLVRAKITIPKICSRGHFHSLSLLIELIDLPYVWSMNSAGVGFESDF